MNATTAAYADEVLVLDDETTICDYLSRALREDNFQVTAMTDPAWIKEAVKERRPCLIIMDVHMPGGNGLNVLKEVKEIAPDIPVVMISGDGDDDLRREARRLGACEFLSKPLNWNYLRNIAHLSSFLKRSSKACGNGRGGRQ
jgi:DNA-binding NtrC family response regulator